MRNGAGRGVLFRLSSCCEGRVRIRAAAAQHYCEVDNGASRSCASLCAARSLVDAKLNTWHFNSRYLKVWNILHQQPEHSLALHTYPRQDGSRPTGPSGMSVFLNRTAPTSSSAESAASALYPCCARPPFPPTAIPWPASDGAKAGRAAPQFGCRRGRGVRTVDVTPAPAACRRRRGRPSTSAPAASSRVRPRRPVLAVPPLTLFHLHGALSGRSRLGARRRRVRRRAGRRRRMGHRRPPPPPRGRPSPLRLSPASASA